MTAETTRIWMYENRDRWNEYQKDWSKRNRDKVREYRRRYKMRCAAKDSVESTNTANEGYTPSETDA